MDLGITCNIELAEWAISNNLDRSRMLRIGRLHDNSHVRCDKLTIY